jgi:hypothetical protein
VISSIEGTVTPGHVSRSTTVSSFSIEPARNVEITLEVCDRWCLLGIKDEQRKVELIYRTMTAILLPASAVPKRGYWVASWSNRPVAT